MQLVYGRGSGRWPKMARLVYSSRIVLFLISYGGELIMMTFREQLFAEIDKDSITWDEEDFYVRIVKAMHRFAVNIHGNKIFASKANHSFIVWNFFLMARKINLRDRKKKVRIYLQSMWISSKLP